MAMPYQHGLKKDAVIAGLNAAGHEGTCVVVRVKIRV